MWATRWALDDPAHPQGGGPAAGPTAADLVANVPQGPLGVIAGADFFTTEVWTWRGLVTYYTVFVIDLASRRVRILGSTPHPNDCFMRQVVRMATAADAGSNVGGVWICDRDRTWSRADRRLLGQ